MGQYSWARQRSQSYSRGQTGDFISLRELITGVFDSVSVTRLCEVCPSTAVMEFKNVVFNAARDGKLRRLKVFLDHRPREEVSRLVSAKTNGATPLVLSCRNGHHDVVEYLVDKCCASVEQPGSVTFDGETIEGAPPLWCAAAAGHLDIVKLLSKSGANVNSTTKTNSTPLRAACFDGHFEIVKYFVDKKRDMLGALKLWKRAMEERYEDGDLVIPKALVKSPISAYENTLEVESVAALEEIISDPDSMRMQALLVRERILGPAHPDTSYYIGYRGAVYADMGHFERCITLWMYALDMQQKILEPLSPMTQSSLLSFAELFSFMMSDGGRSRGQIQLANFERENMERSGNDNSNSSPPPVNFTDIMTVFRRAVKEVMAGQVALEAGELRGGDSTYFNRTIVILLHLACSRDTSSVGRYPICNFPSVPTIDLLLQCGAPVNAGDNEGNTPLHASALNKPAKAAVIQSLLQHGAHFDLVNNDKKTFFNLLKGTPLHEVTNSARHTRLSCLAARVVRKYGLETTDLPSTLQSFVETH